MRIFVAAIAALAVALLAGCGGGGGDAQAEELLRQTFTGQKEVRSGKLDLRMALDARGLGGVSGPVAVHLSGPFDNGATGSTPKFDFALDVSINLETPCRLIDFRNGEVTAHKKAIRGHNRGG